MYKIEVDHEKKQFMITLEGSLNMEESIAYSAELESNLSGKDLSEYYLVVDTSDLKISSHDLEDQMKRGMEMIFSAPFKARYNIVPKSAVTNLQANRVGKEFELKSKFIIVYSYEEILVTAK
ncbi:hypothetical protein [Neobacillus sp. PS2-9]|uniref:hypothetical protein n=1 Tax=Neobacillus sp. PS2-9 TaxID=3070676 RepID=UPI0027DFD753|nr:hypothetical protein [Neobacillus sp. PS2-9]WML58665.1 hypothetical protein RCG25_02400 [Neobacillus sp. PS2-9]